jgi:hypothetical protein
MRNVSFVLMAIVLAAIALPSVAGNDKKMVSLNMSSPAVQTPPLYVVLAKVTNEGNSTINSFKLSYSGSLTIVGVQQPATGNATFTASSVTVKSMSPLKSGSSITVMIDVNTCSDDIGGAWSVSAWTGSQLNGQSFSLAADSNLATAVSCGSLPPGAPINVVDSNNPASCVNQLETHGYPPEYHHIGREPHYAWTDLTYLLTLHSVS